MDTAWCCCLFIYQGFLRPASVNKRSAPRSLFLKAQSIIVAQVLERQLKLITTMKRLFLILVLCCFSSAIKAQYVETVHLKNGSMIRGIIIEQIPEGTLKIQTADGSIFVYPNSEIAKITKEIPQKGRAGSIGFPYQQTPTKPFYMGTADFGYSIDVRGMSAGRVEISTSHGCLIIPHLYIGGGIGIQYYHSAKAFNIPLFADFRGYTMKGENKPYLNFRIGYSWGDLEGLYLSPSFGVSLNRLDISFGYTMQKIRYYYSTNLGAVTVKLGFHF